MRARAALLSIIGLLGVLVLAAPARAASFTSIGLASTAKSVTTSTGVKLHLSVSAFKVTTSGATSKATTSVTLATGTAYGVGETHIWNFQIGRSSFTYSASTGKAVLKTGSQMSPYGTMNLTFKRSSSKTTSCAGGGHITTVSGTLSGIVHFLTNTGSHGWGNVGSSTHAMSFSTPNRMTLFAGCGVGAQGSILCMVSTSWSAPFVANTSMSGFSVKNGSTTSTTITAGRTKNLSKPGGASRTDVLTAVAPVPTFSGGKLTIKTKSGTKFTGSAAIMSSTTTPNSYACKRGTASHTENATSYSGAWSTPTALVAHFRVTGNATAAKSGSGFFTISSYA